MKQFFYFFIGLLSFSAVSQGNWYAEQIVVQQGLKKHTLMGANQLIEEKIASLPQAQFWKQIMQLSPDSCLINVASSRYILKKMSIKDWHKQSEQEKTAFKDSLKATHHLQSSERIFVTTGKNDFYRFHAVYPSISEGIKAFEANQVDPWYAQAILLIESPGQLKKSSVGAYGAFQLMPGVARAMGLTVNRSVDERKDFKRSAYAASRLIKTICIPEAKKILERHQIAYREQDLWFRLFVLHVYHAGALNVAAVIQKIQPNTGSMDIIKSMWQNTAASFGNNSQNYTQLALAAQLIINEMVFQWCDEIYEQPILQGSL